MTFSPSKSTIFVPKNLRNSPKICVDCSATDANYYSYAFKVYLCSECAKIHDTYLGKYDLEAQLRYHCPLLQVEDSYNENYYFNREFEEFLPEFFQKMGARTPESFRKEYITSKYTHKVFTTQTGINFLIPDMIVTMVSKRCKQRATWHPCCLRLDKQARTLQYYSYKSNRLTPKFVIPLREVDLFMGPLECGTYLHLVWTKNQQKLNLKRSFLKRKVSVCDLEQSSALIRNFYFLPSSSELLQLFFSICSGKSLPCPPVALSNTLKRSFSFDISLSRVGEEEELCPPCLPTRKSVCDLLMERVDYIVQNRDTSLDPLIADFIGPQQVAETSRTLQDGLALNISGSYCMDTKGFFSSCHGNDSPVGIPQDDEVETIFKTDKFDSAIDSEFYSCTPGEETNPFLPPTNLFQDKLDDCPMFDTSKLDDGPMFDTSPLSPISPAIWTTPAVCALELDGGVNDRHFYDSIREDISGNKKFYQSSGWLYKAGEMVGDMWRMRWFNLSNTRVTYSESNFSAFPKNHFHLGSDNNGFSVDTFPSVVNLIPPPNQHFFRIVTPHRVYHLCATSEKERVDWMDIISRVIALSFVLK